MSGQSHQRRVSIATCRRFRVSRFTPRLPIITFVFIANQSIRIDSPSATFRGGTPRGSGRVRFSAFPAPQGMGDGVAFDESIPGVCGKVREMLLATRWPAHLDRHRQFEIRRGRNASRGRSPTDSCLRPARGATSERPPHFTDTFAPTASRFEVVPSSRNVMKWPCVQSRSGCGNKPPAHSARRRSRRRGRRCRGRPPRALAPCEAPEMAARNGPRLRPSCRAIAEVELDRHLPGKLRAGHR